jgi:hypothetical protein
VVQIMICSRPLAEASPVSWVADRRSATETPAEAEDAVPGLLALLVVHQFVTVALLEAL